MDELKKYLQQSKEQMDVDTPSVELFQRIQSGTAANKKGSFFTMFVRVAVAASIISVVFLGGRFLFHKTDKEEAAVSSNTPPATNNTNPITNITDTPKQLAKLENRQPFKQKTVVTKKQVPDSYQLLTTFEQNYNKLVSLQLKSIRNTPVYGESPDYFNGFKINMQQIESDEAVLKSQVKTNGLNDELLEQLINIYQQKINLLKNLQHEIGSMNNKIKENKQATDSIKVYYINI